MGHRVEHSEVPINLFLTRVTVVASTHIYIFLFDSTGSRALRPDCTKIALLSELLRQDHTRQIVRSSYRRPLAACIVHVRIRIRPKGTALFTIF